jgi:hypothetical protein
MAIITLDGALAGMQPPKYFTKTVTPALVAGRPHSLWSLAGAPGPGAFDTTLNGVVLSSSAGQVAGQLSHTDPATANAYLARLQAMASQPGSLLLCDRLWHNGGLIITQTTAQSIVSPAFPARDNAGTVNGDGVLLGVEVSAATGAGAPILLTSYTNQAGVAARSGSNVDTAVANSAIGAFYRIGLQAGDTGVRSVQSLTLSATWTSGTINLVAYRVLASLELTGSNVPNAIDALTSGFPRLFNGIVPFLIFIPSTTTAASISGQLVESQG